MLIDYILCKVKYKERLIVNNSKPAFKLDRFSSGNLISVPTCEFHSTNLFENSVFDLLATTCENEKKVVSFCNINDVFLEFEKRNLVPKKIITNVYPFEVGKNIDILYTRNIFKDIGFAFILPDPQYVGLYAKKGSRYKICITNTCSVYLIRGYIGLLASSKI